MTAAEEGGLYLVTGGAGFIGSHLVEALVERAERVRVLDDLSTGKRENLAGVESGVELVVGDITDAEACRRACEGVTYVLHEAAVVSVAGSLEDPLRAHEVNVSGTLNLLMAARDAGCRRLVYAGSASVYGNTEATPQHEELRPEPVSPYAVAKHIGELYCRVFQGVYGLETVVLRYFNVFGPRQDAGSPYSGVIARFIGQLILGEQITIHGDGEQTRDFVAVENVVEANLLACHSPAAAGQVINIGCGEAMSINRLAEVLGELTGSKAAPAHGPERAGDVHHSLADIARARELLGYQVGVSAREGLEKTLAWYRQNAASSR